MDAITEFTTKALRQRAGLSKEEVEQLDDYMESTEARRLE